MDRQDNDIIRRVINSELCVGCGVCTTGTSSSMEWSKYGFLQPNKITEVEKNYKLCPFNLKPDKEVRTEDELAELFLNDAPKHHRKVGRYYNTYVGYAKEFRASSSSGGVATYVLSELLEIGAVDYVVSVGESQEEGNHYTYQLCRNKEELLQTSKTKYYPVSMSEALKEVEQLEGSCAIVGTACFVKAIRLLQHYKPEFKNKVKFVVGIICGGQKSKFYADFLASHLSLSAGEYKKPQFRIKDKDSHALDYSFGCLDKNNREHTIKMRGLGDMWGTGLFKNNACDFCDDVTTELADISLGDAWIDPYDKDGKGTNVIVTRSEQAESLVKEGVEKMSLVFEQLPFDLFLRSQQGSFNHRHKGLGYRIKQANKYNVSIPPKRFDQAGIRIDFKLVQKQRLQTRIVSLDSWARNGIIDYYKVMPKELKKLKVITHINHYVRAILKRVFG